MNGTPASTNRRAIKKLVAVIESPYFARRDSGSAETSNAAFVCGAVSNCPGRVYSGAPSFCGSVMADGKNGCGGRLYATVDAMDGQSVGYGVRAFSNCRNDGSPACPVRL